MKKIIPVIIMLIAINGVAISQKSYQTFSSAGFKVICACSLRVNSLFIQAAKAQGANNIIAAYICAENENDTQTGVIVNINVYDESASFQKFKADLHEYLKKKLLEKYASNLAQAGFSYEFVIFKGETALEYTFDQNGLPTKAIMFYKNQKSYLLQVATRNGLAARYSALKNSFEII